MGCNVMKSIELLNNACFYIARKPSLLAALSEIESPHPGRSGDVSLSKCIGPTDIEYPDAAGSDAVLSFDREDRGLIISFADQNRAALLSGGKVLVGIDKTGRVFLTIDQSPR
jgi:hypothetical protein